MPTPAPSETLTQRIARENARLRSESLARLARAAEVYKSELVTIGDLTVRKQP